MPVSPRRLAGPFPLAVLIALSAPAAPAQPPPTPRVVRPFQPLAQLMVDLDTGQTAAARLKRQVALDGKQLKDARKQYLADKKDADQLRRAVEAVEELLNG